MLAVVGVLVASLGACDTSDCEGNRNALPLAGFMSSAPVPVAIALDTIHIAGLGAPSDSVLSYFRSNEAYLPFNNDSHTTTFVLEYNRVPRDLFDTIRFEYNPLSWFESTECGAFYKYDIQGITYTTHFVDSVTCPAGIIDNTPGQNIFIYLRTESTNALKAFTHE